MVLILECLQVSDGGKPEHIRHDAHGLPVESVERDRMSFGLSKLLDFVSNLPHKDGVD